MLEQEKRKKHEEEEEEEECEEESEGHNPDIVASYNDGPLLNSIPRTMEMHGTHRHIKMRQPRLLAWK